MDMDMGHNKTKHDVIWKWRFIVGCGCKLSAVEYEMYSVPITNNQPIMHSPADRRPRDLSTADHGPPTERPVDRRPKT